MKALILVGGLGTRLRPLTVNTPKAMMPVLNRPFMAHVIDHLCKHGVNEIILTRGHLAGQMESYFGDGSKSGITIRYIDESRPLGTAGGIKNCEQYLKDTFFALNGDVFSTINLTDMLRVHREKGAVATIALTPVENPAAFGLVETESDGRIKRFIEKPKPDEMTTDMINAGCYILEPEVLGYIQHDTVTSIERETFQLLLKNHRPFYAYNDRESYWIDMGNLDKYFQLNMDMLSGRCTGLTLSSGVQTGENIVVDSSTRFDGRIVLGDNCRIGAGVTISGPAIFGDGCTISDNSFIGNAVVWNGVRVGDNSSIENSIMADSCVISEDNKISASALADGVITSPGMTLTNSQIWPGTLLSN